MEGSAHPALKRIEADFNFSGGNKAEDGNPTPRPGTVGDILSEIQVGAVRLFCQLFLLQMLPSLHSA